MGYREFFVFVSVLSLGRERRKFSVVLIVKVIGGGWRYSICSRSRKEVRRFGERGKFWGCEI